MVRARSPESTESEESNGSEWLDALVELPGRRGLMTSASGWVRHVQGVPD